MTEYVSPSDYHPGDIILTEDGEEHIVEDMFGNIIVTTDDLVEKVPFKWEKDE